MMDQREPPRIGPAEDSPREPAGRDAGDLFAQGPDARPFARLLPPPTVRRIAPRRLALRAGVVLGGILGLAVLVNRVVDYLHRQPLYQLSYRQIVLEPPPPPWYRGGVRAFLDHVWLPTRQPRTFAAPEVDLETLSLMFQRSAWVKKVRQVERRYPNRVVVRLVYRAPVAYAGSFAEPWAVIDADGVLLPRDEIDLGAARPLIELYGFPAPPDPRPGEVWGRADPRSGAVRADDRVVTAARIAAFLKPHVDDLAPFLPTRAHVFVYLVEQFGWTYQFVQVSSGDHLLFPWENPRAEDPVQRLNDAAKWAMARDWVRRHPLGTDGRQIHLRFTGQGVAVREVKPPEPGPRPDGVESAARASHPGRN